MNQKNEKKDIFQESLLYFADLILVKKRKESISFLVLVVLVSLGFGAYRYQRYQKQMKLYDEWFTLEDSIKKEKEKKKEEQDLSKFVQNLTDFLEKTKSFPLSLHPGITLLEIYDSKSDIKTSAEILDKILSYNIPKEMIPVLKLRKCAYQEDLTLSALECYRELNASSGTPKFVRIGSLFSLIRITHSQAKSDEAKNYLEEIKKLDPQNPLIKEAEYVLSTHPHT